MAVFLIPAGYTLAPTSIYASQEATEAPHSEVIAEEEEMPVQTPIDAETPALEKEEPPSVECSCVRYLQEQGYAISGDASEQVSDMPANEAGAGDILLFDYDGTAHVAAVIGTTPNGYYIKEANKEPCTIGKRHVLKDDPHIIGAMVQ